MYIQDHVFYEDHRIHTHQADPFFYARLPYYFQVMQEGAAAHAMLRGSGNPDLEKDGKLWVLSRIRMRITRYLAWPEAFKLSTWIQPPQRLIAPREAMAVDASGNVLFRSLAYWVIIDQKTRRPIRADTYLDHMGLTEKRDHWDMSRLGKVPPPADNAPLIFYEPQVQYRDMDSVRHINNISYIEWMLESMDPDFRDTMKASEVEINFLAESFLSDSLRITACRISDVLWQYSVTKDTPEGDVETCRAIITWKPRKILV